LQELKCTDDAFPVDALAKAGYRSVWHGQRTWNGVAILSRGSEPVVTPPPSPAIRRAKKQDSFAVQSAASQIPCGPLLTQRGRKVGPAMVLGWPQVCAPNNLQPSGAQPESACGSQAGVDLLQIRLCRRPKLQDCPRQRNLLVEDGRPSGHAEGRHPKIELPVKRIRNASRCRLRP